MGGSLFDWHGLDNDPPWARQLRNEEPFPAAAHCRGGPGTTSAYVHGGVARDEGVGVENYALAVAQAGFEHRAATVEKGGARAADGGEDWALPGTAATSQILGQADAEVHASADTGGPCAPFHHHSAGRCLVETIQLDGYQLSSWISRCKSYGFHFVCVVHVAISEEVLASYDRSSASVITSSSFGVSFNAVMSMKHCTGLA